VFDAKQDTAEGRRVAEADTGEAGWRDWGPYLAERAWGTVREDYSASGDAWNYFPHDHARSRVYRWSEDGMAGFCDEGQDWCLALALWNGVDPILKERMFGLTGPQGNHGEDVKEYWWYLDAVPSHAWQTWRYHYPQPAYPYEQLITENASRTKFEPEYELVDTGIFDESRYWVVTVDYAKAAPHDLLMRLTVENAGPEPATINVLPTMWFRDTWSWGSASQAKGPKPSLRLDAERIVVTSARSGSMELAWDGAPVPLFCDNATNNERLYDTSNSSPYPKDGINDHVVHGADTVNPNSTGTKAALRYTLTLDPGASATIRVRLVSAHDPVARAVDVGTGFDAVIAQRKHEADKFYAALAPAVVNEAESTVLRQAMAGLLWSKQFYHYDVDRWLDGDPDQIAPPPGRAAIRNGTWRHLNTHDVILIPDPWEYPWFAAWDLAFHCVTLAHIDPQFAKDQLILLLREWYMHPIGAIPAYEWNFSDVNPPVHAWAALQVYEIDGGTDHVFLARVFHKLLMNFTWWVNNKDKGQDNLFEGGFLGLDNIAPLDRSSLPPEVGTLEQADATAWMAMYALDLLDMAVRLALIDIAYEDVATKFFEHFLTIAGAANAANLWDEEDAYYYDVLHLATGQDVPLKVKSLVGLVPVTAALAFNVDTIDALPEFKARLEWFLANHPELAGAFHAGLDSVAPDRGAEADRRSGRRLLALVPPDRLIRVLCRVFDEARLLSLHGIRSVSAWHREHPFDAEVNGVVTSVGYEPAESTSGLYGGNSNWRGPIWFPLNALLVEALRDYDEYARGSLTVEYPVGSGRQLTLGQAADDVANRLIDIFTPGTDGRRAVHGDDDLLALDPRWRDNIPFHEYFHGDTGAGLGAAHQTGWTALVAHLILTRTPGADH
jgi:hypothetical protein